MELIGLPPCNARCCKPEGTYAVTMSIHDDQESCGSTENRDHLRQNVHSGRARPTTKLRGAVGALSLLWVLTGCPMDDMGELEDMDGARGESDTTADEWDTESEDDEWDTESEEDESDTESESDSEGESGEDEGSGYEDCDPMLEEQACSQQEVCLNEGMLAEGAVCALPCATVDDCPPAPASGEAPVMCLDLTANGVGECILGCGEGQACPEGMGCVQGFLCMWPAP